MGIYTTVAAVRAEPEVPAGAPPADVDLEALIAQAEDRIDELLGVWPVQDAGPSSGRKIVQADVDAWRWSKIARATTRLAARLYADPEGTLPPAWKSTSGPDFSQSNPASLRSRLGDVVAPLEASGLRNLSARAS